MTSTLEKNALDQLFHNARTHNVWLDRPVSDAQLQQLYDLVRMGPTSANSTPLRLVFVKSAAAKEKLKPTLAPMNVEKTMSAPATAIVAFDTEFHNHLPTLFPVPGTDMKGVFDGMPPQVREQNGRLNAALQAGYLIIAARALGLDCGGMAGFDNDKVDTAFLEGTTWKSLILVNLGYGDAEKVWPRNPRLSFDEAVRVV